MKKVIALQGKLLQYKWKRNFSRMTLLKLHLSTSNVAYCLLTEEGETSTLQEALNNPDASFWKEAMQEEIKALHKNKTWELVPLP
ncbi:hypothetical protein Tco_1426251 [Tanacetum coccineum]